MACIRGKRSSLPLPKRTDRTDFVLDRGSPNPRWFKWFENRFGPDHPENPLDRPDEPAQIEPGMNTNGQISERAAAIEEFERDKADARKALRTASWAMMFFLVGLFPRLALGS